MTTAAHLANYDVEYDVELRDAILMGLDRVEHQLTLGSGGPGSAEMQQMIDLMLANDVFYVATHANVRRHQRASGTCIGNAVD